MLSNMLLPYSLQRCSRKKEFNHPLHSQVNDLFDEEEVPAAAARGVYNLLMVHNTDLRALYDKYWCAHRVTMSPDGLNSGIKQSLMFCFGLCC